MTHIVLARDDQKFRGSTIDIPEHDLTNTLKRHPTWRVLERVEAVVRGDIQAVVEDAPKAPALECPICGKEYKTEGHLQAHKQKH